MIHNRINGELKKLPSETGAVYTPVAGWSYAHHPSLAYYGGRFWALWSCGHHREDDAGQQLMLAESADGLTWGTPYVLVTPGEVATPDSVLTAAGFHQHAGRLYVYYGVYRYAAASVPPGDTRPQADACHEHTDYGYLFTEDGIHWSRPVSLGVPVVPNQGPYPLAGGRLLIAGNVAFPYTDSPDGVADLHLTGIYGDAFGEGVPVDDSGSISMVTRHNGWGCDLICEGSFYQTDDGVVHMLLRSNHGELWVSESADNGESWSAPTPTAYTSDNSKFHFGRLPDGRFYGVSNAVHLSDRTPLHLHLSADGEAFDTGYILRDEPYEMMYEGVNKGGLYGYPHSLVQEGYLYVIYSKRKEAIEITRVALDRI